jgi:hypothetical protein
MAANTPIPTDAEAWALWLSLPLTGQAPVSQGEFARAVLARWGAQPAPEDSVLEDAARYRYLTRSMGEYCVTYADENGGGVLKAGAADAAIDAARKQGGA